MFTRPRFDQADRLVTESVKVDLPLSTKNALADAARRQGRSMSGIVREAVEDVIACSSRKRIR